MMGPSGIEYPRDFFFLKYQKELVNQSIIKEKGGM